MCGPEVEASLPGCFFLSGPSTQTAPHLCTQTYRQVFRGPWGPGHGTRRLSSQNPMQGIQCKYFTMAHPIPRGLISPPISKLSSLFLQGFLSFPCLFLFLLVFQFPCCPLVLGNPSPTSLPESVAFVPAWLPWALTTAPKHSTDLPLDFLCLFPSLGGQGLDLSCPWFFPQTLTLHLSQRRLNHCVLNENKNEQMT